MEPELIYTQHHEEEPIFDTYMKYPVTALGILRFIKLNRSYLKEVDGTLTFHEDGDAHLVKEGGQHEFLEISKRLVQVDDDEFDADIIEFDDEFEEEGLKAELVYSIIVNRYVRFMRIYLVLDRAILLLCPSNFILSNDKNKPKIELRSESQSYLEGLTQ